MSNIDLARIQFASTSIYHFLFVPVTIGLAFLVAVLQTIWHKSGKPEDKRLIKFFGTLLLINVAVGVVTGLIQEFEFGMNWSYYSRYVGAVFGAPLAMEGLAAFFLESTFLGLWIFGWDRLPKRIHLACIWLVAVGAMLSAAFIMAANSWMQHPVGYTINQTTHVAELNNIWALFTNPVFYWGYTHVILASLVTGSVLMIGVSAWHLRRKTRQELFKKTAAVATIVLVPAIALNLFVGSELGRPRGHLSADEDRRRRGAVDHVSVALLVLAVPDRGGQQRRDADPDPRGPRSPVDPGHQPRRRRGPGPQQPPGPVHVQVRAGELHPQRVHPVLVDAGHGVFGRL